MPSPAAAPPRVSRAARLAHRLARVLPPAARRFAPDAPLVSFTFDDVPETACTRGAGLLAEHGARATYYVAGDLLGTRLPHYALADADGIAALHAAGHEIGCHTHAHPFLPGLSAGAVRAEAARNAACLRAVVPGLRLDSFAYPFGYASPAAKAALAPLFASARGIRPGLNRGLGDRMLLRANPLIDGQTDAVRVERLMDAAAASQGWLVLYGHDVDPRPSPYGCTPGLLAAALRAAQARGIACVTIAEGLRRAGAARHPRAAGHAIPA